LRLVAEDDGDGGAHEAVGSSVEEGADDDESHDAELVDLEVELLEEDEADG